MATIKAEGNRWERSEGRKVIGKVKTGHQGVKGQDREKCRDGGGGG